MHGRRASRRAREFTKRAFLNGRLDLAQAEAVADLIMARSEAGRRLAWSQLEGSLSTRVERLREAVLKARAHCEVALDFPDEDLPELTGKELAEQLASVRVGDGIAVAELRARAVALSGCTGRHDRSSERRQVESTERHGRP